MTSRKLSAKQRLFIEHYVSEECFGNATEAARRAGYKGNDETLGAVGYENIKKPQIAAEITALQKKIFDGAGVTIEGVLRDLQRNGLKAEADGQYAAAINAAVHQGRYLKMFTDKIEQVRDVRDLTDAELMERIRLRANKLGIDVEPLIAGYTGKRLDGPDRSGSGSGGTRTTH